MICLHLCACVASNNESVMACDKLWPGGEDRKSFYAGTHVRLLTRWFFVAVVYRHRELDREDLRASVASSFLWPKTSDSIVHYGNRIREPCPLPPDFFLHQSRLRIVTKSVNYLLLYAFPPLPLRSRQRPYSGGGAANRSVFSFVFEFLQSLWTSLCGKSSACVMFIYRYTRAKCIFSNIKYVFWVI